MKKPRIRRTTVILDEKDREYLNELIEKGEEQGVKPFLSKMMGIYRELSIYDWKYPGEYYCGFSRVALFSRENLDILIESLPKDEYRKIGERMGNSTASSFRANLNIEPTQRENWTKVLERLSLLGYGEVTLRGNAIMAKNPFINDIEILLGFMEGLLGCSFVAKTTISPIIIEAQATKETEVANSHSH